MIGKFVLVRTYSAGVHVGTFARKEGTEVILFGARRIWRWRGANTLNELSQHGTEDTEFTRISEPVPEITLTEAIEIIPVSEKAKETLGRSTWRK
jgi:hypothetical protein